MTSRVPMCICFSQGIWQYQCVKSTILRRCTTDDDDVIADGGHGDRTIHKQRRQTLAEAQRSLFVSHYDELCTVIGDDNVRVEYSYYRRCLLCGPPTIGVPTTFALLFIIVVTCIPPSCRYQIWWTDCTGDLYYDTFQQLLPNEKHLYEPLPLNHHNVTHVCVETHLENHRTKQKYYDGWVIVRSIGNFTFHFAGVRSTGDVHMHFVYIICFGDIGGLSEQ
jgi:hypothetical protein